MSSEAHQLNQQDASLLMALFNASQPATPWVEAAAFRHAHVEHRKAIDRLIEVGAIRKERIGEHGCYCVSLTVLAQLGAQPAIAAILETANSMWQAFREHFKKSSSAPLTLRTVADLIDRPLDHVTLVHTYMREWWHTPYCHTPADAMYQSVIVDEHVFDHASFDDCIQALCQDRLTGLHAFPGGVRMSSALIDGPETPTAAPLPAFVEPSWFAKLPPHAQALMREIHAANHSGLVALTAMGIRAVIDVVADDLLGAAGWAFAKKLTALSKSGHLTPTQHEALSAVVEVGHAAAHRAHVPSERDVLMMFEVLHHVLLSAYGLQNTPSELKARTPPKPHMLKADVSNPLNRWSVEAVIIDLDGTMVDTLGDFDVALNATLVDLGRPRVTRADIERMVGKGSAHLIRSALRHGGLGEAGAAALQDEAWALYQAHYRAINGAHSAVYPGVEDGLRSLQARGLPLACLTNKPLAFARDLLQAKGLDRYFAQVFGGDSFERVKPDPLPLIKTCEALGTQPAATLMVGDSQNDALAARAAGCPVVLVTYGYNHGEPIASAPHDALVDSLASVPALLA